MRREEFVTHPCEGGRDGLALEEHLLLGAGFAEVTAAIGRLTGTRALHLFVALRRDGARGGLPRPRAAVGGGARAAAAGAAHRAVSCRAQRPGTGDTTAGRDDPRPALPIRWLA
ncbi:hypothetical protein [Calidithermus roseus]|uniref:hypothetical protein n=1 Tax=Calidithermus roseus TaxID=1644118 RepID=UPI0011C3B76E|nr:hypothetical protein [Calidithermus roseus]